MGIFNNLFKSDKLEQPVDLSLISTDMHSHLIPGIDDGAQTIEESIDLIRSLYNLGYKKIVTTPHVMLEYAKNTPAIIHSGLEKLKTAVAEAQIPMSIEAAAEYMLDDGFAKKFRSGELLTFGKKYVLIELSVFIPPDSLFQTIFDLKLDGFNPVLAHPERYFYWHYNFEHYVSLKDREILFQINLPSLSAYYSPEVKKITEKLIDNNMVDFIGTDLHSNASIIQIEKCRYFKYLEKLVNSGKLLNKTL
ncbi:MAG: CpsB/CapC family capsule biosynthesis tyrosine phosphatase [Bacteroidales bacterium]